MRIALAQIDPTIGDLTGNSHKIIQMLRRARDNGAALVVFGELALTGYPPRDWLLRPGFVDAAQRTLHDLAAQVDGIDVLVGYPQKNTDQSTDRSVDRNANDVMGHRPPVFSALALLRDGQVVTSYRKRILSDDPVLDEGRYFQPGPSTQPASVIDVQGHLLELTVGCEGWLLPQTAEAAPELRINCAAECFILGGYEQRLKQLSATARQLEYPIVHVNQAGANDELIFEGASFVLDSQGELIAQAQQFEEDLLFIDLPAIEPVDATPEFSQPAIDEVDRMAPGRREVISRGLESVYEALVMGIRDYARKCGFKSAVLGLSGGIDSALVAALATAALGADHITGVAMPSRYSSQHSRDDARQLAQNLKIVFHEVPIDTVHGAFETTLTQVLARPSTGSGADMTGENLQARARGMILMALSNKYGHLLLSTGNKSEAAVGYCTLYGDMCGGLAVISDVPKTMVYELSHYVNRRAGCELIPQSTLTKAPSAELHPNQTDQDSLPPYDVLDAILLRFVEQGQSAGQIVNDGFDPSTVEQVIKLVMHSEHKRRQAAPGLRISRSGFGIGRRMPVAAHPPVI